MKIRKIRLENFTYKGRFYEYFECEINTDDVTTLDEIYEHVRKILDRK